MAVFQSLPFNIILVLTGAMKAPLPTTAASINSTASSPDLTTYSNLLSHLLKFSPHDDVTIVSDGARLMTAEKFSTLGPLTMVI